MTDYRALALALHNMDGGRPAPVRSRAVTAGIAAAEAEVRAAEQAVRAAEAALDGAHGRVADVDERCRGLWRELATLLDRDLGALPEPHSDGGPDDGVDPLERASERIGRAALGEPVAPVPHWTIPVLPPAGALATLLVALPIWTVMGFAGGVVSAFGEIMLFFVPFAGIPPLIAWTRRRYGTRPDIGAMALTAVGGMIASGGLALIFR